MATTDKSRIRQPKGRLRKPRSISGVSPMDEDKRFIGSFFPLPAVILLNCSSEKGQSAPGSKNVPARIQIYSKNIFAQFAAKMSSLIGSEQQTVTKSLQ